MWFLDGVNVDEHLPSAELGMQFLGGSDQLLMMM